MPDSRIANLLTQISSNLMPVAQLPSDRYPPMAEGSDRMTLGPLFWRGGGAPPATNNNASQAQVRGMIPEPLSLQERNWQNYGKQMHPDEVMASEPVWGGSGRLSAEAGISESEAFSQLANDLWSRMGANRYISPESAKSYMRVQRGLMNGIKGVE